MDNRDTNLIDIFVAMYKNKGNRKLVSKLYSCLQSNKKHSTNKIRLKWENVVWSLQRRTGCICALCSLPPPVQVSGGNFVGGTW